MISIETRVTHILLAVVIIFFFMTFFSKGYCTELIYEQANEYNTDEYINEIDEYIDSEFDINIKEEFSNMLKGNTGNTKNVFLKYFFKIFGKEIKSTSSLLAKILIIVLVSTILNSLTSSLEKTNISNIVFFISYISIIILIMNTFNNILVIIKSCINTLSKIMYATVPMLFSIILSVGNFSTANIFQPLLLGMSQIITIIINKILIPLVLIFTVINIVSNLSEKEQLKKLAIFIKESTIWILGIMITVVVGIMALEGNLSSGVDALAGKTVKTAISSFIPVVGKGLSDAIETVMGSTIILKNAVGTIGTIILLAIGLFPIIKVVIMILMFSFTTAIIEPIAEKRIISCMSCVSDSLKLLLGILITVLFIYIVSITLLIKISNFTLMIN